jgi:hypothetical protein
VKVRCTLQNRRRESGIALLIAIFVLLLISVVGIALIVSSGTESALAGNYRSSTGVYYASIAGLEEVRGRLLAKNPHSFLKTAPANFLPPPGTQWDIGYVSYIFNPGPADPADPRAAYADTEYDNEFGNGALQAATNANQVATTPSVWNVAPLNALPVPGPSYKWVRINAVSEVSLGVRVAPIDGHAPDPAKPIYYDGTRLTIAPTGAQQVLEITSLAVLPNGSQKMLQYLVALVPANIPSFPLGLSFPAALTIAGSSTNGVAFSAPTSNTSYYVSGVDLASAPSCTVGPPVRAVGVFEAADITNVKSGGNGGTGIPTTPTNMQPEYDGMVSPGPDIADVSGLFPSTLQTPSKLDNFAQSIIANADAVLSPAGGTAVGSDLTPLLVSGSNPSGMSSTNPLAVIINGDLDLNGWHNTGYGLLLVTGNLNYDPDATWKGIVLVIGKGTFTGSKGGSGEFDGAVFVAQTRDSSGKLLPDPDLGKASVIFGPNMGSVGIRYSSCWVKASQPTGSFKTLSFHEISQ